MTGKKEKALKGRGGPGRGGGRKKGGQNKRTIALREVADKALQTGQSPLDVMMDNLLFWHRAAKSLGEQLEQLMLEGISEEDREKVMKLLKNFLAARENSQRCAVEAAPYVHPKLSSIAFKGDLNGVITHITADMTPAEAQAAYEATLRGEGK